MLHIPGSPMRLCDQVTRRDFLTVGGLGAAGLALPSLLKAQAESPVRGRAKSCILLFMGGGPPQIDTFDLKPNAPAEIRGILRPIATTVPGLQISEQLPMLSRQMHHCSVIRSMSDEYTGGAHGQSVYLALTGHKNARVNGDDVRPAYDDYPCMGAAVARVREGARQGDRTLPPFVWLLDMYRRTFAGVGGGFLGAGYDPFRILQDPSRPDFRVTSLAPSREIPIERLHHRRSLFNQIRPTDNRGSMDVFQERAFDMILAPRAQAAFDLGSEPANVRDRYGRHKFGQGTLMARRLIEHGVPLVTVYWNGEEVPGGWDLHYRNYEYLPTLAPMLDRAFSALLEDLSSRGLLDETLVVWMGEFGRAPLIEAMGGRGHWGRCYSVVLAGAGIRPGVVHGRSDRAAAYPTMDAVSPQELVATIYHCLGIPRGTELHDTFGRPLTLYQGAPVQGVLA